MSTEVEETTVAVAVAESPDKDDKDDDKKEKGQPKGLFKSITII